MAASLQVLVQGVRRPPRDWLPDFLRALAAEEEQAAQERFLALVEQFQRARRGVVRHMEYFSHSSEDPVLRPMLDVIVEMAAELQVDPAVVCCDCEACVEDTRLPLLLPGRCKAAHDLRAIAATLTSAP